MFGLKKTVFFKYGVVFTLALAGLPFIACNAPMGMGPTVDTTAPTVIIDKPVDNFVFGNQTRGQFIEFSGRWYDDLGVTELTFADDSQGGDTSKSRVTFSRNSGNLEYSLKQNNTWTAGLKFEESGDYTIRITAYDTFRNAGAAVVKIRVHLQDPWVQETQIRRHNRLNSPYTAELKSKGYYEELNYGTRGFIDEIKWADIDFFQNEKFTLRVTVKDGIQVSGAGLAVFDENDAPLNSYDKEGVFEVPSTKLNERTWEWEIDEALLAGWDDKFASGPENMPHFIKFEVWAWNEANWDPIGNKPREYGTYTQEQIGGTCWFPASDIPHVLVSHPQKEYKDPDIFLNTNETRAMILDIFDDDQLAYIYAGLVTREQMNDLLLWAGQTEAVFIKSLETDPSARQKAIDLLGNKNLFDSASTASTGSRRQSIEFNTGDAGEFRLIAIAGDNKDNIDLDIAVSETQWKAHPPLRVFVVNNDAPIIIIEEPQKENVLPALIDGRKFIMGGYTIDFKGTNYLQIAWIPDVNAVSEAQAQNILKSNPDVQALPLGGSAEIAGIKVWKLDATVRESMTLSGRDYYQDRYSKEFDIVDDFTFGGVLKNQNKLFVIHTYNGENSDQANAFKSFQLPGYTEKPVINTEYPPRDLWTHDNKADLVLKMRVDTDSGIGVDPASVSIVGMTGDGLDVFTGPVAAVSGNVYQRTILKENVKLMQEGVARSYQFGAADILGNVAVTVDRKITMSNIPVLRYIRSTFAPGSYGIGEVLRFEAVFSMPVVVNKNGGTGPKLKLYFSDPGNTEPVIDTDNNDNVGRYADYHETPASSTLLFTYTVKEGDNAPLLYTSLQAIDDNDASLLSVNEMSARIEFANIEATEGNSLQERTKIGIDGVKPTIESVAFINSQTTPNTNHYYNNGKTVYLRLNATEQLRVAGSPVALLGYKGQTGGGRTTLRAAYTSISHTGTPVKSAMTFTYEVNDPTNNTEEQLEWLGIEFGPGTSITDIAGNHIHVDGFTGSRDGGASPAYIDTRPPATPTFTLRTSNTTTPGQDVFSGEKANKSLWILINGETNSTMYYSTDGGSTPKSYTASDASTRSIPDNTVSNILSTYTPVSYSVTAWQVDRAGNRSAANAAARNVTINSRAPELNSITCPQPDGYYKNGNTLEFKLAFSSQVIARAGAQVNLNFAGTLSSYTSTAACSANIATTHSGSILTVVYTVASGLNPNFNMRNIKVTGITFTNLEDEYGNPLKNYTGTNTEDGDRRPITNNSSFNLNRNQNLNANPPVIGLNIDTGGPTITGWNPDRPTETDKMYNGGVLSTGTVNSAGLIENAQIALTFNKKVTANSGKYIYIRPWNNWAVPPILTAEEHNELYNAVFTNPSLAAGDYMAKAPNTAEYQKRLKWLDHHGLPQYTAAIDNKAAMLAEKEKYNYYAYTTHGLKNANGRVRPDTTAKWVLAFRHDLYSGTTIEGEDSIQRLRDVFNAARWKWQTIPVTAGVASTDGRTVTFTIPNALEPGRIWEVVMDTEAFRDDAGNNMSGGIAPSNVAGAGYRFWSSGTAAPVIRVDRYSHGDHYHGHFDNSINAFPGYGAAYLPQIDTRVRIDCETPGAAIRYDTIRTSYAPRAAKDEIRNGINGWFNTIFAGWRGLTPNYTTAQQYFDHPYVNESTLYTLAYNSSHNAKPNGWNTNDSPYSVDRLYGVSENDIAGYTNNWIGNGGSHQGGTQQSIPTKDGYFSGLLVPVYLDQNGARTTRGTYPTVNNDLANNNGTIAWSDLTGKGSSVASGGSIYKTFSNAGVSSNGGNGNVFINDTSGALPTGQSGYFFYVGEAYGTTSRDAVGSNTGVSSAEEDRTTGTDSKLFSGRRDYIAAAAQKSDIDIGPLSGPELTASSAAYEGVFKTTVVFRAPNGRDQGMGEVGTFRVLIQGFDTPVNSTIAGFPLNNVVSVAPYKGPDNNDEYYYFTRQAWRVNKATNPVNLRRYGNTDNGAGLTGNNMQDQNNYFWVSWEIVSDWYLKASHMYRDNGQTNGTWVNTSMKRDGKNYDAILATYGAFIYRYEQFFEIFPASYGIYFPNDYPTRTQ